MTTIVLWVGDLERSVSFYKDLFSASDPYITDGFASVSANGNEVLLHLAPAEYRKNVSVGAENPIKPVFPVDSLERIREILTKHNCKTFSETLKHGNKTFLDCLDPDGHVIQVVVEN